ncbi:MAG: ATP-binding protein [Candidatus Diapherotrites archaeon]
MKKQTRIAGERQVFLGTIGRKLIIGFIATALFVAIVGSFGFYASQQIASSYEKVSGKLSEDQVAALEVSVYAKRAEGRLLLYLALNDENDKNIFFERYASLASQIKTLEETLGPTGCCGLQLEQLNAGSGKILALANNLLELHDSDPENFSLASQESLTKELLETTDAMMENATALTTHGIIEEATEAQRYAKKSESSLLAYLALGSDSDKKLFFENYDSFLGKIALLDWHFRDENVTAAEKQELESIKSGSPKVLELANELVSLREQNPETFKLEGHAELTRQWFESSRNLRLAAIEISSLETERLNQELDEVNTNAQALQRRIMLVVIAAFGFAIFAGIYISSTISEPIRRLYSATKELEKGNLDTRVEIKTNDELEQLGKTFNNAMDALGAMERERKEVESAKTSLLSISSHELRSPMTPIKGQLQLLLGDYYGKISGKQRESLEIILRNTNKLDRIVADFLDVSMIEAGRVKFDFRKTKLNPLIVELIEEEKHFLPEKKIKIATELADLPEIETDSMRTMQVLNNLLNNAVKFSPNNSAVTVKSALREKDILFSVKDSGAGIEKENLPKIFNPFFQEEKAMSREHGGVGLGLAISKGIIDALGGKIWVESVKGKGSTFYFTLPLEPIGKKADSKPLF